ncbi:MAG: hypothetical protein WBB45_21110 [Cyclobacteriaceae bacterium]
MEAYKFQEVVNSLSGLNQSLQNILTRLNQDIVVVNRHLEERNGINLSGNMQVSHAYESPDFLIDTANRFPN